jgi:hypothetical protein
MTSSDINNEDVSARVHGDPIRIIETSFKALAVFVSFPPSSGNGKYSAATLDSIQLRETKSCRFVIIMRMESALRRKRR